LVHELISTAVSQQSLEASFNKLVKTITKVTEKHASLQTVIRTQKRLQPWLGDQSALLKMIKFKQKLYKTHFLNGNETERNEYKQFANKLTR